jgi:hypothetical protein
MDQFDQINDFDPFSSPALTPPAPTPPAPTPPAPTPPAPTMLALPPLAIYPSQQALFEAIQAWAKPCGYAFSITRSRKANNGRCKVQYGCDRRAQLNTTKSRERNTQSRGLGCLFSIIAVETIGGWEVRYRPEARFNTHNHPPSQSPAAHPSHRHLSIRAQNSAQQLYITGKINLYNLNITNSL